MLKQLKGLGCPTWLSSAAARADDAGPAPPLPPPCNPPGLGDFDDEPGQPGLHFLRVLFHCSDRGPDQEKGRKVLHTIIGPREDMLYVDWDCTMHAVQLIFSATLDIIDRGLADQGRTYKFFNSLAKLVNCWRENWYKIYEVWIAKYGALSATTHARRQPARCLCGRWGSFFSSSSTIAPFEIQVIATRVSVAPV